VSSIAVYVGVGLLALGIFSFDAWQNGDQMNLEISIPQGSGPSEASITDAVAADLFLNEIADIDAVPTFVAKPKVRSINEQTIVSLIGEMLGLKNVTLMIQQIIGLDSVVIKGAVIKHNDRYQLVLVSNTEDRSTQRLAETVETAPGETVVQMIRRAAPQTMLNYQDYLVCLYLLKKANAGELGAYEAGFDRPGLEGLDRLIQQRMQMQTSGLAAIEDVKHTNLKLAMFTNLRGMLALTAGDDKKAAQFFDEARITDSEFVIATLNLAFVRVHQDRYQEAIDLVRPLITKGVLRSEPALLGPLHTTWAVAAWGLRNYDEASTQFHLANEVNARATLANLYWSEMLDSLGDKAGAAAKMQRFIENSKYFSPYAETAIFFYRLTPNNNAPLTKL
jgi:tetratricopeptide (TPR) repeat protein